MTTQEAKEICNEISYHYAENGDEEKCEALDIAEKSLDKDTPKKPYPPIVTVALGSCGVCNASLFAKHKHCHNCGQAIDWEQYEMKKPAEGEMAAER